MTNRGIVYEDQNKRQKLIKILDEELRQENLANIEGNNICLWYFKWYKIFTNLILGLPLRNRSMVHHEQEIR